MKKFDENLSGLPRAQELVGKPHPVTYHYQTECWKLEQEIKRLREDIRELKDEQQERNDFIIDLLENKLTCYGHMEKECRPDSCFACLTRHLKKYDDKVREEMSNG